MHDFAKKNFVIFPNYMEMNGMNAKLVLSKER